MKTKVIDFKAGKIIPILYTYKNFKSLYFSIFRNLLCPYINMTGRNSNIVKIGGFTSFSIESRMPQGILRSTENADNVFNIFSLSWLWWNGPCTSITSSFEDRGLCFSYSRFETWESWPRCRGKPMFQGFSSVLAPWMHHEVNSFKFYRKNLRIPIFSLFPRRSNYHSYCYISFASTFEDLPYLN